MRSINRSISLLFFLFLSACAGAPAAEPTSLPTNTTAPPTRPPAETPTSQAGQPIRAGQFAFAFYHPGRGQILLVNGGPERGKPADDPLEIWAWNGQQWALAAADENGPAWRNWPAVAYDPDRDVLVVHGGLQTPGRGFAETWEWDGNAWKQFTDPGGREGSLMAYDAARGKMVLFGGAEGLEIRGDTWEWENGTWKQVADSGPAPRFPAGMIYDPARQQVLLYSGHYASPSGEVIEYDDLWAWDGSAWEQIETDGKTPGPHTNAALAFDPQTGQVLLFSGSPDPSRSDVWAWEGRQWTELPASNTPVRSGGAIAYDPGRDRFVFFGGVARPGGPALSDTWEWDRRTWTCISQCQ